MAIDIIIQLIYKQLRFLKYNWLPIYFYFHIFIDILIWLIYQIWPKESS